MKKKVTLLVSIAGTGDPSPASLASKYARMASTLAQQSVAAQSAGKPGKSPEDIAALVDAERRKDARIPRLAGFDHEFSFKPKDVAFIDAALAVKWQEAGICIIEDDAPATRSAKN